MSIVSEQYELVIGVDTHAANHAISVVTASTGAAVGEASFPTSAAGLDRAQHLQAIQPALLEMSPRWVINTPVRG
ncbi:hypothetical protein OG874_17345 [Nocardia sp. NBC_00565]|uniref:hypothetical protein n=1 Tax=Nocardia sp. NBC_00565 TaxID=2975993 RepID=UPI002E8017FD|nr:hypothetical protein [Nocardia sp. NBC_00565]WUC06771.1 hypothetical protein OG874_17345 [Nocardia sp. NBC_00565]